MSNIALVWAVMLVCYISLVPYYFISAANTSLPFYYTVKYFPFVLNLSVLTLLVVKKRLLRNKFLNFNITTCIIWSTIMAGCISAIGAESASFALGKTVYIAVTGVVPFYIVISLNSFKQIVKVLMTVSIVSALVCIYGIYSHLTSIDVIFGNLFEHGQPHSYSFWNAISTIGNPSILGTYLLVCFPITAVTIYLRCKKYLLSEFIVSIVSILFLLGIVTTYSRGALISFVAMYLVFALKCQNSRQRFFQVISIGISSCIIFFVINLYAPNLLELTSSRIQIKFDGLITTAGTVEYRVETAQLSYYLWLSNPVNGIGLGHSTEFFNQYFPDVHIPDLNTIDNQFLTILVETGLIGLIAHCFTFVYVTSVMIKQCLINETEQYGRLLWACIASLIGLNINMLTWDALNFPTIRILCWMMIGIGLSISCKNGPMATTEED